MGGTLLPSHIFHPPWGERSHHLIYSIRHGGNAPTFSYIPSVMGGTLPPHLVPFVFYPVAWLTACHFNRLCRHLYGKRCVDLPRKPTKAAWPPGIVRARRGRRRPLCKQVAGGCSQGWCMRDMPRAWPVCSDARRPEQHGQAHLVFHSRLQAKQQQALQRSRLRWPWHQRQLGQSLQSPFNSLVAEQTVSLIRQTISCCIDSSFRFIHSPKANVHHCWFSLWTVTYSCREMRIQMVYYYLASGQWCNLWSVWTACMCDHLSYILALAGQHLANWRRPLVFGILNVDRPLWWSHGFRATGESWVIRTGSHLDHYTPMLKLCMFMSRRCRCYTVAKERFVILQHPLQLTRPHCKLSVSYLWVIFSFLCY